MDFLTFITKMTEIGVASFAKVAAAAAWPIAIVVLALKFRVSVGGLLSRLTEATLPGGISTKFTPFIDRAETKAEAIPEPDVDATNVVQNVEVREFIQQASLEPGVIEANPTGVIMEMWLKVIGAAESLCRAKDASILASSTKRPMPDRKLFQEMMHRQLILPNEYSLLLDLQAIRNHAAHSQTNRPSSYDAERFRAMSEKLILTWALRENDPANADAPRE
ncbi:hypothetical protein QZL74_08920 [Burkholderia gladioli pv. alliicola]|uniref:hypothetical protein n=1 Tax=Burkholderia gladioli TaxID=28095 RepID=UPI003D8189F6